jgi:hypothetical protein
MVDLERREVVDVLPVRSAKATWPAAGFEDSELVFLCPRRLIMEHRKFVIEFRLKLFAS